ncbi:transglutaminase-like cysteine peptidase [Chromobacterium sp. IIBBL 290-4]|uniref:transglutaminase-like cysteine peptidase n=1 Tax=Chromobacterium sp. IIBBL 290-4 TaxID=2953890 RepID=UPI0020B65A04|nr:transglutaminase-like cysteine peptidase [Chromobacterium sp. IIBBL 290-4]UTH75985.1 transglutaminase-like cysteine peptidase [Chromobacterium sp. IIBBL 290-4]
MKSANLLSRWRLWRVLLAVALLSAGLGVIAANLAPEQSARRYGPRAVTLYHEWTQLLGRLQGAEERQKLLDVNQFFNRRIQYRLDIDNWGVADYWATPLEMFGKGAGDCKAYSIGKYISLLSLGVAPEKLRITYVKARIGGPDSSVSQAHMVLAYYPAPTAEPLLLDNLVSSVEPASQRPDLTPVFSFNAQGLWVGDRSSNVSKLTRWRQLMDKMQKEGFTF